MDLNLHNFLFLFQIPWHSLYNFFFAKEGIYVAIIDQ